MQQGWWRLAPARGEALPRRKKIEQQVNENGRVAADMTAVIKKLAFNLGGERLFDFVELTVVT